MDNDFNGLSFIGSSLISSSCSFSEINVPYDYILKGAKIFRKCMDDDFNGLGDFVAYCF